MFGLEADDLANHGFVQPFGVAQRPAGTLLQPVPAVVHEALFPFIPGLGADPVLLAQRTKIFGAE